MALDRENRKTIDEFARLDRTGGGPNVQTLSGTLTLQRLSSRNHFLDCDGVNRPVIVPAPKAGFVGDRWRFLNVGTDGDLQLEDEDETAIGDCAPGESAELLMVLEGGVHLYKLIRGADAQAVTALSEQRLAALNWAVDGKNIWAPPHVDDILTDVLVIWRGTAGTVTAGTLTLGKLEAGAYGAPVNQLAAANYDLTGLAVNTPTSLAAFLHGTVANRTFDSLDVLEAEITGIDIGDDGFVALIPVFSRP